MIYLCILVQLQRREHNRFSLKQSYHVVYPNKFQGGREMKRFKWIGLSVLALALIVGIPAAKAAKKLTPRPPIYGIPAKTLPQGKWIFRGYVILPQFDKMYNAGKGEMVDIPTGMKMSATTVVAKFRYGVTNRLTAIVNIPYIHKEFTKPGITKSSTGAGDVIGALLYKLIHNRRQKFLFSALLFTKYPTGQSANLGPTEMPLGTGSFDIGAAVLPEKEIGKWDLRWSAFYIHRGKNKSEVDLGDALSFSWSSAYNFSRNLIAEGTLLYKMTGNNSKGGKEIANSGTHVFQVIPGVQYRIRRTLLLQVAMPITLSSQRPFSDTLEPWLGWYYLF